MAGDRGGKYQLVVDPDAFEAMREWPSEVRANLRRRLELLSEWPLAEGEPTVRTVLHEGAFAVSVELEPKRGELWVRLPR
jgi:hypothetical protein